MQDVYCRPPEEEAFHTALELRKVHNSLQFRRFEWINNPLTHLVIDDVIDTGNTIRTVRQAANWEHVRWFAAAAIVYSPLIYPDRAGFSSSVEGYERIFAAEVVQGVENPIPLNSLTSFVEGGEKTERLVRKCLDLFVPKEEQEVFLDALLQLRKVLMYN